MIRLRTFSTALVLLVAMAPQLRGQSPESRIDEIFARWDLETSPGCAVGVTLHGRTVVEQAYGMADLENDVPNTPRTIFEGGSLSKQFTAAAIVLLVLDGRLSLDDDVRTYLPEVPDYGPTITLRHMMTHTSGLRDWGSVAGISGWGREKRSHDHAWVLDIVSRQSALNFTPGHEYSYSNTGYNLLAMIVDRVSGMSFADFSATRIFDPLGMADTQWRDDYRRIVRGRSSAYNPGPDGSWRINRPIEDVHGNGGILTTVGDLGIWNAALEDGRLGGADFVRMMHDQGELADGSTIDYAAGLVLRNFEGVPSVTHTGATAGYRAFLGRYPDQELSVAMLCNAANVPTGGSGSQIARIMLGGALEAPRPTPGMEVDASDLTRYAGLYRDPVTGQTKTLSMRNGVLRDRGVQLVARSTTRFQAGGAARYYVFDESAVGRPGFTIDSWEYTDRHYEPVEEWTPDESALGLLTGDYRSEDAETTYHVAVKDGQLFVTQRPGRSFALAPIYPGAFQAGFGRVIRFEPGRLRLSQGRVYDMVFGRIAR